MEDMTEPELRDLMTSLAQQIEMIGRQRLDKKPLFALVVFNDPKVGQYICNCERETMIEALRETAERLEKRQDVPRVEFPR